jgi:hypothetical protein
MSSFEYDNGYAYTDPLPAFVDRAVYKVQREHVASLILVDGGLGSGKSTMAAQMLRQIDPGFVATEESFKLRYLLGGTALLETAVNAHEKGAKGLIFDEAGIDLSSRSAMSTMNRNLNSFFQLYRALKLVVILVLPSLKIMDRRLLYYEIHRFQVHTHSKVHGSYTRYRLWDTRSIFFLKERLDDRIVPRDAYFPRTGGFSNADGYSKALPKEYQDLLDKFGLEAKKDRLLALGGKEGITIADACGRLKVTPYQLRPLLFKHGVKMWSDPNDKKTKMFSLDDFDRLRTLEFGGEEAL